MRGQSFRQRLLGGKAGKWRCEKKSHQGNAGPVWGRGWHQKDRLSLGCPLEVHNQTIRHLCETFKKLPTALKEQKSKRPSTVGTLPPLWSIPPLQLPSALVIHSSNPPECKHSALPSYRSNLPLVAWLTLSPPSGLCSNAPFSVRLSLSTLLKTAVLSLLCPVLHSFPSALSLP